MAEDIISTLPDSILCYILSFLLETKHVVATSILSKRWNHLWFSVPTLYFDTEITNENSNHHFNNFVSSVLLSRDATLPIKSFHFEVEYDSIVQCSNKSITKWVNFVLQRGVENLHFYLYVGTNAFPKLPVRILTCTTLVNLELLGLGLSVDEGYSSVQFPSLKTLELGFIHFPKLRDLMLFLSGCPILDYLITRDLSFNSDESLSFNEWKSFCLSKLTMADIDCTYSYFPLKAVHNVRSLSFGINEVLYRNDVIPTFHNLTELDIMCSDDNSWQFLVEVLNHCPKLQKLDLNQAKVDDETWINNFDKENWVDTYVVPQCLSLHLRKCSLLGFFSLPGELILAKYILKNAKVLQTMEIWNCREVEIKDMLSSYPRASSMCKLMVYDVYQKTKEKTDDGMLQISQ